MLFRSLATGDRLRIFETPEELIARIASWRQRTLGLSFFHEDPAEVG